MKAGDIGPLQAALCDYLDRVRLVCETGGDCRRPTHAEVAKEIGFPPPNVYAAIARLRRRRSLLVAYVRDGRETNRRRPRHLHKPTPKGIADAARRSLSLLERAWRGSDLGELA